MKRAAIYARVSTDEQAEKGYSLPSQIEGCKRYAVDHDLEVITDITDDYTGTKLDRPGLDKLRGFISRGEINAVIVYTSDRWSRKLAHLLILREELERAEIELHFVNRGKSEDTPESRMTENIEGVFNEYWREKIVESSRRGSYSKARSGKVVGAGNPPFGYYYADGQFQIIPEEAKIVRLIYSWYLSGDGDGRPMVTYQIASKLALMGVITSDERRINGRGKLRRLKSGFWQQSSVNRILSNETYTGTWHYGKRTGNPAKIVAVSVPAIIAKETFEAAQERSKQNKLNSARNTKHEYLLRGLVKCGYCGYRLFGTFIGGDSYLYYSCQKHTRYNQYPGERCPQKSLRGDYLQAAVWDRLLELMNDSQRFEQALYAAQEEERSALEPKRERLEMVNKLLVRCENEAEELISTRDTLTGGLMKKVIEQKAAELENQYASLNQEREELEYALSAKSLTDEEVTAALQFREDVMTGMLNPTFEDKRFILETLRVSVAVKGEQGEFTCVIPVGAICFDLRNVISAYL
jgi:site-specific DNA recombinase